MASERKLNGWRWGLAAALLMLLAVYVGGYFALSRAEDVDETVFGPMCVRVFNSDSVCHMYRPLGWCECQARRKVVWHGVRPFERNSERIGIMVGYLQISPVTQFSLDGKVQTIDFNQP